MVGQRRSRNFSRLVLVGIAHYPSHAGQSSQFFRRALRVAAGHQNPAIRIHPLQSSDRGTCIFIRPLGHGAGVQHNNFGIANRTGSLQSALQKLPIQRGAIRLCSTAAKILYVEASHAPILNEWMLRKATCMLLQGINPASMLALNGAVEAAP